MKHPSVPLFPVSPVSTSAVIGEAVLQTWSVATHDVAEPLGPQLMGWLDALELERAAALRTPTLQADFVVAHAALRLVLSGRLACGPADLRFERSPCPDCGEPHGRRALTGREVEFSLARTKGRAVVTVSTRPVGVDVETVVSDKRLASVAPLLHPREQREIEAGQDPAYLFTRTWTRKEAYLKGLGVGLGRDLGLDYLGAGPAPEGVWLNNWLVLDLALPEGYVGAVAVSATEPSMG